MVNLGQTPTPDAAETETRIVFRRLGMHWIHTFQRQALWKFLVGSASRFWIRAITRQVVLFPDITSFWKLRVCLRVYSYIYVELLPLIQLSYFFSTLRVIKPFVFLVLQCELLTVHTLCFCVWYFAFLISASPAGFLGHCDCHTYLLVYLK